MLSETAGRLVGLIVIETLPEEQDDPDARPGERDATLAEFLAYLASHGAAHEPASDEQPVCAIVTAAKVPDFCGNRFGSKAIRWWARRHRVSADLQGLASELERVLAQARRKLAAAR